MSSREPYAGLAIPASRKRKAEADGIDVVGYEKSTGTTAQNDEVKTYWKRCLVSAIEFELEPGPDCGHSSSVLVHQQLVRSHSLESELFSSYCRHMLREY